MAKAVGLDIGSRAVKVVVLEGGPKGAKVLRYAEQEYEYGEGGALTPAVVLEGLKRALSAAKAPKQVVSYALPAEQCILREITVPFENDDQIRKVVKFEFEPHLHNAAIEDTVLDYVITGPARAGTRLLIFAAHKDVMSRKLSQLREVGVDPLHVDIDMAALFNVAHTAGVLEEHPNCLVIDIGARTTKALFVQQGRLKVARSIRLGSTSVKRALVKDFHGDEDAADRALEGVSGIEALALPPAGIGDTLEIVRSVKAVESAVAKSRADDFMSRVLRETQRTLSVAAKDGGPTRVYLTGGGSLREHARERIAEQFGVEVEDLPVLDAISHKLSPENARKLAVSGAVALGTGLKVLGIDAAGINLRQDEFRFARTFDQIKTALATGVTLAFFAIFLGFLIQILDQKKVDAEFKGLHAKVEKELRADVFDAYQDAVTDAKPLVIKDTPELYVRTVGTSLTKVRSKLKDELGLATEVPPILSCLKSWATVMTAIQEVRRIDKPPRKIEYLAIKNEKYEQDKAMITIVVGKYSDIDTVTHQLRAMTDVIAGVNPRAPKPLKDAKIEISIEIELVPPDWERLETGSVEPGPVRTATAPRGGAK